ncbi:hypothetical protein AOCH_003089, partial [Aspergillus ochraceoroseus]
MPPARRHSKPVSSGRYLVLRHRRHRLNALRGIQTQASRFSLQVGEQKLSSSYVPGLRAGTYQVSVDQTVKANTTTPEKTLPTQTQVFNVLAPQFALAADCIYSTFPAAGASAPVTCLPHVVLNDPLLPWERVADELSQRKPPADDIPNRVPWLACLTFQVDELRLSEDQLNGEHSLFARMPKPEKPRVQSATMAVDLDVANLRQFDPDQTVFPTHRIEGVTETRASVILVRPDIFTPLVTTFDRHGQPQPQTKCDVSRYRFLAHVRHIHTDGMAHAGAEEESHERSFGIVVSHRTGPPSGNKPTMLVSHLVSIESVYKMDFPLDPNKVVGLPSLFSWTHMCLPPQMMDIPGSMSNLAETRTMLQPALVSLPPKDAVDEDPSYRLVHQRLQDGYSLVRWRTQTGDETIALTRGPLVPSMVDNKLHGRQSNSGQSLQILDRKLGIMDISYSTAWNLGRALAMADATFTAALCRVRKAILQEGTDQTRIQVLKATGVPFKDKRELIRGLKSLTEGLAHMSLAEDLPREHRWQRPPERIPVHSLDSTLVDAVYQDELNRAAYKLASGYRESQDEVEKADEGVFPAPYDEHNIPYSADWTVVLRFVLDLRFLIPVPFHYLVPDMSYLPQESLRFFHIDENWVHALVDGALSLGNHVDREKDRAREAIHNALLRYHVLPHAELDEAPPVPMYGFLLRSNLVTQFPDLRVTVKSTMPSTSAISSDCLLARHEVVDPGIMLGLLTQAPDSSYNLIFTQPPHQQCFTLAKTLTGSTISIPYKKMYSEEGHDSDDDRGHPLTTETWTRVTDPPPAGSPLDDRGVVYLWGSKPELEDIRMLHVENLARNVYDALKSKLPYTETKPTAAMMGIQLNDPCWQLEITPPPPPPSS